MVDDIRDTIQDCNLNFLLGSGLSRPFLKTLEQIENLLTELDGRTLPADQKECVRASIYKKYFDDVIYGNLSVLNDSKESKEVLDSYIRFLKLINSILLRRKSSVLSKEVNLFTTNIDIFLEKALDNVGVEYNDGFTGRFVSSFDLSNFKKVCFKKSLYYDNMSEVPVFNLIKLHGSVNWTMSDDEKIIFSNDLKNIKDICGVKINTKELVKIGDKSMLDSLISIASKKKKVSSFDTFLKAYEKLPIVNPTKEKFKHTLLNETYYEMLRIYSNELEKENTVLFSMGFSFADEHIRDITVRSLNANPTLKLYVFAHSSDSKNDLEEKFNKYLIKNKNLEILSPELGGKQKKDLYLYDLKTINDKIFDKLFTEE